MSPLRLKPLLCPLAISLVCILLSLSPEAWQDALQYQREAILDGQVWRLISGQLTHLNATHLVMNLVGLWLIWLLFFTQAPCSRLCLFQLPLILLGCALGLILFSPDLAWYRGLSGTLHGLLALALLSQWGNQPFIDSLLLALFLAKVAWEQIGGPMPGSEAWIDGRVIVESHLYGTISGSIIWMLARISNPATEKLS